MSKTASISFVFIALFLTSCIPTKKLAYLQQDESHTVSDFTITKKPEPYNPNSAFMRV